MPCVIFILIKQINDTVEGARQAAAASGLHGYQNEDLQTREVVEKGLVGELEFRDK